MITTKQSNNLNTLEETLADPNLTLLQKQQKLEKLLIPENRTENLVWLPFSDQKVILQSKKQLLIFAEEIMLKTKISPQMSFITPEFLVVITLNVLTKMFNRVSITGKYFSYTSLVRSVADHFIRQVAWNQKNKDEQEGDGSIPDSNWNDFSQTSEENAKKLSITIAAKIVDHLEPAGIAHTSVEKSLSGKSYKSLKSITLSSQWFQVALQERDRLTILPMIYPPNNWSLDSYAGETRLIKGGYLSNLNKDNTTSLLDKSDKIFKTFHSTTSRDNINYIQSLPYKINKPLLKYLRVNLFAIKQYKESYDIIKQTTREEYCGIDKNFEPEKALIYDKARGVLQQIEYNLHLLNILQNTTIYFPLAHDGRGRLYPMSYPINPVSQNYIRSLITCEKEYEFGTLNNTTWNTFVEILSTRLNTTVTNFKKNPERFLEKLKKTVVEDFSLFDFIEIYKKRKVNTKVLIGYDVTASGLQMMSILSSNLKGLTCTHVFESKEKPEDIYYLIHNNVVKDYPILDQMLRSEYKAIIMKMSYGESSLNRGKDIQNYFKRIGFVKKYYQDYCRKNGLDPDSPESLKSLHSNASIGKRYETALEEEFPTFLQLKNNLAFIVKTRSDFNLPINFTISDIYKTTQYYNLDRATNYTYRGYQNVSKRIKMYIPKTSNEKTELTKRFEAIPDKLKIRRASMPNLIHHLDSWVLQELVSRFRQEDKPLFTVHDAFYCRLIDINFLKQTYYEALQQISKATPWKGLLELNKITLKEVPNPTPKEDDKIKVFNTTLDVYISKVPDAIKFKPMSNDILH